MGRVPLGGSRRTPALRPPETRPPRRSRSVCEDVLFVRRASMPWVDVAAPEALSIRQCVPKLTSPVATRRRVAAAWARRFVASMAKGGRRSGLRPERR
jgi:hypothetical protein